MHNIDVSSNIPREQILIFMYNSNTCTCTHNIRASSKYSTLQHTATHCNTLQHTATHCNTIYEHARIIFSRLLNVPSDMICHMYMYIYLHSCISTCIIRIVQSWETQILLSSSCIFFVVCVCIYVSMYSCMYASMYMCIHVCMYICIHACISTFKYYIYSIYIYMHIFVYIYKYICIYIYTYIPVERTRHANAPAAHTHRTQSFHQIPAFHVCDMTHLYVWHDAFTCIHMSYSYV